MEPIDISSTDSESSDWDLEDYKAYNEKDPSTKDSATSVPNTRVLPSSFGSSSLTSNAGSSQRAISAKRKAPMNGHSSHFNQDYDDQLHNFRRTLPSSLKQFSSSSRPSHLVKDVGSSRSHETYGQTWQSPVKAYNEDHFGRSSNDVMNGNRHGSRVLPQSMNPPMSVPTPQYGGAIELYRPAGVIDEQEVGDERLIYQTALQDLHQPITEADISSTDSESIDWYFEEYKAYHEIDSFTKDLASSVPNTRVLPSSFVSSSGTSNADVSSSDSESSDWDLERFKELNEPYMDMATSLLISESSLGMTSSGYRLCVSPFSSKGKAPTKDVMKDKHHGSRVVFPSVKPPMSIPTEQHGGTFFDICHPLGGFNEQTVSNARLVDEVALPGRNQPVTEANLPESINSALLGLKNPRFVTSVEKKKSSFQTEAVRQLTGSLTKVEGLRFAIVVARFNEIVSKLLLKGALDTFKKYLVRQEDIVVVWVPGSFEIGLVAEKLGKSGKYHAILCIGAVVRGDTTDYDVVANSAASGVLSAGLNSGVPCIFGVLTCDDMDKALSHAGGKAGNKGSEAALTAIEMASLFEHHLKE